MSVQASLVGSTMEFANANTGYNVATVSVARMEWYGIENKM
jgi:hypothetical protein